MIFLFFIDLGNAPFAKHDVTSKSAMLGIGHGGNQYFLPHGRQFEAGFS